MILVAVEWCYGKNESSTHSIILNSMHPEHLWVFLNGGDIFGAIFL
jgi:hypothetical protein